MSGLLPLWDYLEKNQIRVINYVDTHPILRLCLDLVRLEGVQDSWRWRKKQGTRVVVGVLQGGGGGYTKRRKGSV